MNKFVFFAFLFFKINLFSQQKKDTIINMGDTYVTLSEVVVSNRLNVPIFIQRVKEDTSFYKAFRNLRMLNYNAINDIRMQNSENETIAWLHSTTKQIRTANCRTMQINDEQFGGDIYNENHEFNYYTAKLYASLFFTKDSICGESNIVSNTVFSTQDKTGLEKNKEQLKMLFFNPGKKINGIPFMSNKTSIYDEDMIDKYDLKIDYEMFKNIPCYKFTQNVKNNFKSDVVIDEMTTWFDENTYQVMARNYNLSYNAGVYDFKIKMEVEMTNFGNFTVPTLIRYNGNWKAIFKKREHGIFTATLYDFKN